MRFSRTENSLPVSGTHTYELLIIRYFLWQSFIVGINWSNRSEEAGLCDFGRKFKGLKTRLRRVPNPFAPS